MKDGKTIQMARNIGQGRAVDITDLSEARLDQLLGIACTECGADRLLMRGTKIIGTTTTYHGDEHYLRYRAVRIVAVHKGAAGSGYDAEGAYLTDDEDIARAGGVTADDRVEVQPWIEEEGRFSTVSSDPRAVDLARFSRLAHE